ncbi:MAG: helix-turn-helix domain-containing protein [Nanoarchaeota archaeon]
MKTIFKKSIYDILELFYKNHNKPVHLREIARKTNLNESTITTRLKQLEKLNILKSKKEANLKKFNLRKNKIPEIFPIFDNQKIENLPLLRKNAIKEFIFKLKEKPLIAVVFGSTAKDTFNDDSDLDIIIIANKKLDIKKAKSHAEALTSIKMQIFQIKEDNFYKELKMKEDNVIQSGINTGFPVFNNKYFYELIYSE